MIATHQTALASTAETAAEQVKYQCECLPGIKAQLAKHHGTDDVDLELASYIDNSDMAAEEVPFILGFKPLFYRYMDKRKVVKRHVSFQFCPMCGKPLK